MPRGLEQLTDRFCKSAPPGRHRDGGGLYLTVSDTGARSWLFFWKVDGKRHAIGLGAYRDVTLKEARNTASKFRLKLRDARLEGSDQVAAVRRKPLTSVTFATAADKHYADKSPGWKNPKHRQQWRNSIARYAKPVMGSKSVAAIDTADVLKVLQPIWVTKPETGLRVRGRIENVLDWAKANGYRSGDNPARWRGHLDKLLPQQPKLVKGHHPAMAIDAMPEFMSQLRAVRGATWDAEEIDFDKKLWTVPASRMKTNRDRVPRAHRVPLSDRAVAILKQRAEQRALDSNLVFPGFKRDRPLSDMALTAVLRRMGIEGVTVHGFRSSFRDWAGDKTNFPRELAEFALAHKLPSAVEEAYRRSDALERRRKLMDQWASFLEGKRGSVVPMAKGGRR